MDGRMDEQNTNGEMGRREGGGCEAGKEAGKRDAGTQGGREGEWVPTDSPLPLPEGLSDSREAWALAREAAEEESSESDRDCLRRVEVPRRTGDSTAPAPPPPPPKATSAPSTIPGASQTARLPICSHPA